ncbi:MAG: hypothetical protein GY749_36400 [Desulfobacteraceae bacterium]|nr:hypothetical protein [Desulfobacteraceae bacterium]
MKWEDIEKNFDGEWVLIKCVKVNDITFQVVEGEVLYHSPDMGRVYSKLLELRPDEYTIEYIGEVPEDLAVAL